MPKMTAREAAERIEHDDSWGGIIGHELLREYMGVGNYNKGMRLLRREAERDARRAESEDRWQLIWRLSNAFGLPT